MTITKEKITELLESSFIDEYIRKKLRDKENVRRIFFGVIMNTPARMADLTKFASTITRKSRYTQLYILEDLKLIKIILVRTTKDKEILKKFEEWTCNMEEETKSRFLNKTRYFELTKKGEEFIEFAYNCENTFRKKQEKKLSKEKQKEENERKENEKRLSIIFKEISEEIKGKKIIDKEKRKEVFDKHIKDNPQFKFQISKKFDNEAYQSLLDIITKDKEDK